jgi:hypothetical protein
LITDYSGWANRVWGHSGDAFSTYGACAGTPASDDSVSDDITIIEAFNGASIDGDVFTFPSSADSWAGFANMNTALYPITVAEDSVITFTGSVPAGGDAVVRFRFEKNPYPDTEPSFNTDTVTVSGADAASYSISVPSQGANTFNSFLMYLDTRDVGVSIADIAIAAAPEPAPEPEAEAEAPADITLTVTTDGSAARITGPWWSWDPNGGPEATDNGDGTFSVTLEAPTENMQYLWVVDGVQENLVDNAANAECTAEIDGGSLITDYSGWANRVWELDSGDASSIYGTCDTESITAILDFDGNGVADALTDGMLFIRYAFGLTDNFLVDNAIAINSPLSHSEIFHNLENARHILDIDADGNVDALTDGLIILRYLFNLRDDSLVNGAIADNAMRTDAADIEAYIQSLMPDF